MFNKIEFRWLKLKEATQYAKINKARLIDLAKSGIIKGHQDQDNKRGDWVFDKMSIDNYREAQMTKMDTRQKSLATLRNK